MIPQGASTGAGLGNQFLSHIQAVDGIFQVVRAFDDAEVTHVEGEVDPIRDMEIIQTELRLKDIEWVEKHLDRMKKTNRSLGSNSLADKAKKEEIVRISLPFQFLIILGCLRLLIRTGHH
jgi:obg-like ATPase 1